MILFEVAIPVKPNDAFDSHGDVIDGVRCHQDGWKFTEEHHKIFFDYVVNIAGGYTRFAPAEGFWKDGEDVYNEPMIPVRIAVNTDSASDSHEIITNIANFAKEHYSQLAIFVAKIGTAEII